MSIFVSHHEFVCLTITDFGKALTIRFGNAWSAFATSRKTLRAQINSGYCRNRVQSLDRARTVYP